MRIEGVKTALEGVQWGAEGYQVRVWNCNRLTRTRVRVRVGVGVRVGVRARAEPVPRSTLSTSLGKSMPAEK